MGQKLDSKVQSAKDKYHEATEPTVGQKLDANVQSAKAKLHESTEYAFH